MSACAMGSLLLDVDAAKTMPACAITHVPDADESAFEAMCLRWVLCVGAATHLYLRGAVFKAMLVAESV